VVIMSAFANLESAVEAIRMGVADYLVKPFENLNDVSDRLERVVKTILLQRENEQLMGELRETNERLEELVVRDSLTGLFNHAYFQERLEAEVRRSQRHEHRFGLVFFDVDHFKEVNDGLGHQVGDSVLKQISEILRGNTRASDDSFRLREHDLAARYGGDEFVLILPETDKAGAATKAERLRACVQGTRFEKEVKVTLSVGVAAFPEDGNSRDALVHAADTALYAAKRLGRNRVMSYTPTLAPPEAGKTANGPNVPAEQLFALERSINEGLFETVFQPIIDAKKGSLYGYEALSRPSEDAFGDIVDAIATAERAGQVVELGRVLRQRAIEPIDQLPEDASLFINLHPHELYDPTLLDDEGYFAPHRERIVFELTQSATISDQFKLAEVLANLRSKGFRIALDNLPATYAGLNALTQVEVDFVKLDRSLLKNIQDEPRRARLVKHLLELAIDENIIVVAEGIETQEQFDTCLELGFPLMQGFFFGKGQPPFAAVTLP
jgi:diguanylate cyclase (GGDEF)-like protein